MEITKVKSKDKLKYFKLFHPRLTKNAKVYRDELEALFKELMEINKCVQIKKAACQHQICLLGDIKSNKHLFDLDNFARELKDFSYEIENYIYRLHAYRDKMLIFINYALKVGFDEGEKNTYNLLVKSPLVVKSNISTELKKFEDEKAIKELLKTRKAMSHRIYYSTHISKYLPGKKSPSESSPKEYASEWKKIINKEASAVDTSFLRIADINKKLIKKVTKYLDNLS